MAIRKHINLFLVLLMLGAQIALAQHATVHFTDHGHTASHQEQNDDTPQAVELCQLCILAKGFAHAVVPDGIVIHDGVLRTAYNTPFAGSYPKRQAAHGYLARGPPDFLI